MKVTAIAAQKGGAGKTTTSFHLGVELERLGEGPVCLIDLDEQGNLAKWAKRREDQTDYAAPRFLQTTIEDLPRALAILEQQGFKHVVIDTPGRVNAETDAALKAADLVIIPSRPSAMDLDAIGPSIRDVLDHKKPLVFLVNATKRGTRIANDTIMALAQHGRIVPTTLGDRIIFSTAYAMGASVQELEPESKSAFEVRKMTKYILEQYNNAGGKA